MKNINQSSNITQTESQIKTQSSDSGRSMVEMLGVLAVVGVLSIAGIAGYRFAMDKYVANRLVNELNIVRTNLDLIMERGVDALTLYDPYDKGAVNTSADYTFDYACGDGSGDTVPADCKSEQFYFIEIGNLDKRICFESAQLMQHFPKVTSMLINDTPGGGERCAEINNEIRLVFENLTNHADIVPTNPQKTCTSNADCTDETAPFCGSSNYCEACPTETPAWNGTKCVGCTPSYCEDRTDGKTVCEKDACREPLPEGCRVNGDCKDNTKYCKITAENTKVGDSCYQNFGGSCQSKGSLPSPRKATVTDENGVETVIATIYRKTDKWASWWDANNWCEAHGLRLFSLQTPSNRLRCSSDVGKNGSTVTGYCNTADGEQTAEMTALLTALGNTGYWWTRETYQTTCDASEGCDACYAFTIYAGDGWIGKRVLHGNGYYYAVCEK